MRRDTRYGSSQKKSAREGVGGLMVIIIGWCLWYFFIRDDSVTLPKPYSEQIKALESAGTTLAELEAFVTQQTAALESRQAAIGELKSQADSLLRLVAADRAIVEAVLEEQQRKYQADVWKERAISFVLGVASSILASLIWISFSRRRSGEKMADRDA